MNIVTFGFLLLALQIFSVSGQIKWKRYTTEDPFATTVPNKHFTTGKPYPCGMTYVPHRRVVGGNNAAYGAWPFAVALKYYSVFLCGGVLIHPKWVLGAAHCALRLRTDALLGNNDLRVKKEGEQQIRIKRIIRHSLYNIPTMFNNDIAMFELERPVMFSKYVQPICLPKQNITVSDGKLCYVAGWGDTKQPSYTSGSQQQIALTTLNSTECARKNSNIAPITDQMFCAANIAPHLTVHSACHGDSGGPLHCQRPDGRWELEGIVSWGSAACNTTEAYSVFVRVGQFRDWIDDIINNPDEQQIVSL